MNNPLTKQTKTALMKRFIRHKTQLAVAVLLMLAQAGLAQTAEDAIMMNKAQLCNGLVYMHSSWENYWEGTLKRNNENLGKVSNSAVMYMGAYGITDDLNVLASLPYVWTKASAGTLHGMSGVQDLAVDVKWRAAHYKLGKGKFSAFLVGGFSTPLSDYVVDFLPLSIGLGTTNVSGRLILDYHHKSKAFITGSAAYVWRSNTTLDRTSYYDTELHLTNEVQMPNAWTYQVRAGYRGKYLIAEAILNSWNTIGGFDITRNNMPFPSNKMNSTDVGVNFKYTLPKWVQLSILGGASYVVAGRNVGQSTSYHIGAFYAFYVNKKEGLKHKSSPPNKQ